MVNTPQVIPLPSGPGTLTPKNLDVYVGCPNDSDQALQYYNSPMGRGGIDSGPPRYSLECSKGSMTVPSYPAIIWTWDTDPRKPRCRWGNVPTMVDMPQVTRRSTGPAALAPDSLDAVRGCSDSGRHAQSDPTTLGTRHINCPRIWISMWNAPMIVGTPHDIITTLEDVGDGFWTAPVFSRVLQGQHDRPKLPSDPVDLVH